MNMINEEDDVIVGGTEDEPVFNMADQAELSFEALPKGDYTCVIDKLDYGMSKSSNKPMWTLQLEVQTPEDFAGKRIFAILSFSPKALPGTKSALLTFAPELANSPNFNPKKVAAEGDLLGRQVRVRTKIEEYEGNNNTRVARWLPVVQANGSGNSGNAFMEAQ